MTTSLDQAGARGVEVLRRLSISVVIPAFNEQDAIAGVVEGLVRTLRDCPLAAFEIVVIDDGSLDATAERVPTGEDIVLLRHRTNRGYGAAIKSGLRHARYEWICITDADGTYPNERIPDLALATPGNEMVVGARTADDVEYPLLRRIPKAFLRRYAQWVARSEIADMNSGLRLFRRDTARKMAHLLPDGFSFTTTITIAMMTSFREVRFVPVGYARRIGTSKIRPIRDTLNFLLLIVRTGTYFAPFRVFMPPACLLFVLFVASAIYDVLALDNLTDKTLILLTLSMNTGMFALLADMIHKRNTI